MRVSKVVREYIESEVSKKYASYGKKEHDEFEKQKKELFAYANQRVKELNQEFRDKFSSIVKRDATIYSSVHLWDSDFVEYAHVRELDNYRTALIRDKVSEIVLELELGGTKADLDRLLSEISCTEDNAE